MSDPDATYRDPDWLHQRYHDDGLTQQEIAQDIDVHVKTIRRWMKRLDVETREVEGENHGLHGTTRSEAVKAKISKTMQGREFSDDHRERISAAQRGESLPVETRQRISDALSGRSKSIGTRRRMSESTAGDANPNWRGGYSRRYGSGWSVARDAVRERDTVCQCCGRGGENRELDVHHIVPVRRFREEPEASVSDAHVPSNLVLLCKSCHVRVERGSVPTPVPDDDTA